MTPMIRTARLVSPIMSHTAQEVLASLKMHNSWCEVWLDLIEDLTESSLIQILDAIAGRGIVLFRRPGLAVIQMSRQKRDEVIDLLGRYAANNSPIYLDLDYFTQQDDLTSLRERAPLVPLILSYHNYDLTPPLEEISKIRDTLVEADPTMVKIASFCHHPEDALVLLAILRSLVQRGVRSVVLGMGVHGLMTRIVGSYWGNELIFVPARGAPPSAPGQFSAEETEIIFDTIARAISRN